MACLIREAPCDDLPMVLAVVDESPESVISRISPVTVHAPVARGVSVLAIEARDHGGPTPRPTAKRPLIGRFLAATAHARRADASDYFMADPARIRVRAAVRRQSWRKRVGPFGSVVMTLIFFSSREMADGGPRGGALGPELPDLGGDGQPRRPVGPDRPGPCRSADRTAVDGGGGASNGLLAGHERPMIPRCASVSLGTRPARGQAHSRPLTCGWRIANRPHDPGRYHVL